MYAGDYFDPSLLATDVGNYEGIDLSVFSNPGGGLEGERNVSIYINDTFYSRGVLNFKNGPSGALDPEFPIDFFDRILALKYRPVINSEIISAEDFRKSVSYSDVKFDQAISRVDISIPQAYLGQAAQLKSMPEHWDQGVTAFLMDYRLSGSWNKNEFASSENIYASSNLGFNLSGWRLRSFVNYSLYHSDMKSGSTLRDYDLGFYSTYLEKDLGNLRSTFKLGELSTPGRILDSFSYIGGSIYSNDDMLNDKLRNYTPTIRGIANSQAIVTVKQNGRIILQKNVPAGPFEINDFSPFGYAGDLFVHIKESDGQERSFIQPFSTLPEMKREGVFGYNISIGKYDNRGARESYRDIPFIYGFWSRGFSHGITSYGETIQSDNYQLIGLGSTLSLGYLGAVSGDMSVSRVKKDGDTHIGQSYGFKYSKNKIDTGTTLTLATYRYSTEDFYSFSDFASIDNSFYNSWSHKIKNRFTLDLSQSLGDFGYLSLMASQQNYWASDRNNKSVSLSHGFNVNNIYFSTSLSLEKNSGLFYDQGYNKTIGLYVSMPISNLLGAYNRSNSSLSYNMTKTDSIVNNIATLTGPIPETNAQYRVSSGWANGGRDSSHAFSINWNGDMINASAGYTHAGSARTVDYSFSGGAIMYPWGMAFTSGSVNNGAAVVDVQGISGVKVRQGGNTSLLGTSIVSSIQPYTENRIDLDPQDLPDDVTIGELSKSFIPEKGAVIRLKYDVFKGKQVIFNLKKADGSNLPFGTVVSLAGTNNTNTGIVDDDGRVYFAGVPEKGSLRASFGKDKTCDMSFNLKNNIKENQMITEFDGVCR